MMKNVAFFSITVLFISAGIFLFPKQTIEENIESDETLDVVYAPVETNIPIVPILEIQQKPRRVNLPVAYVSEAPDNIWEGPWRNACEEASIAMVEKYYAGDMFVSVPEAKELMQALFDIQGLWYGSDANSDAMRIVEMIDEHATFKARIQRHPTLDEIKNEIDNGRPVIALHRGFDLENDNIPFNPARSSYHTTVVKGYDDDQMHFIVNDPGDDKEGVDHEYDYDVFMSSLHDFSHDRNLADGPPTAIFTLK